MSESLPSESELPMALTTRDQWLCWRSEERNGKLTKVPIDPTSGGFASTTDSATWSDFETAIDRARNSAVEGLGFVFTEDDPIVGVDLDDCRIPETGKTREWATDIIDRLDSYTEISPSESGYHILVEGSLPDGRNRKGDIELYETARFFTVTGNRLDETPSTVEPRREELEAVYREYLCEDDEPGGDVHEEDEPIARANPETRPNSTLSDQALLERAKHAANGEKFARLWRGNTAGYESHSEADMALCSLLAFWTGGDAAQMDKLFRDSGLFREKWDERHFADGSTYGEKTIERAIAGTKEFYKPSAGKGEDIESDHDSSVLAKTLDTDRQLSREREFARVEQLEELETKLRNALDETERLRVQLESERDRRRELEAELEQMREEVDKTKSRWLPW